MNIKTVVALVMLLGHSFCIPPIIKDGVSEGKETGSSIEADSHESRPGLIQHEAQVKETGKAAADHQESIDSNLSRLGDLHISGAIKEKVVRKNGGEHSDQEKLAAEQADFESMRQSFAETETEINHAFIAALHFPDEPTLQLTQPDINILASIPVDLRVVHNVLLSLHEPLNTSSGESLVAKFQSPNRPLDMIKDAVKVYKHAIHDLFQLLQTPTHLPAAASHLRLDSKSCILKTLDYLRRHKLIPVELQESIISTLRSPAGLEWLAQEIHESFVPDSQYSNKYHYSLDEVEFLENHPRLEQFSKLYKGLQKNEQFLVLFYRLKIMILNAYLPTHQINVHTPERIPSPASWHTTFLEKMEKILLKEFEQEDHHLATVEDFSELRHEVSNIRNFFVEPAMGHEIDATLQHHLVRYSFLILDFLQKKLGPDYMEAFGMTTKEHNTEEFQATFRFMKSIGQMDVWKIILMDYGWFIMRRTTFKQDIPEEIWRERSEFYWDKLVAERTDYIEISKRMVEDPSWQNVLHQNPFIFTARSSWDWEIQTFGYYKQDFTAVAEMERDHPIQLPRSYLVSYPPAV
ncbi:hypothetical protein Pst134EA_000537 [Puccinia striiformis f. sp. tritici]|nr:hypothetical protein Pst134EA_000537 [Puccinia striiformis f. sp. tritici]KAH9473464.1 hypothetical protein Pst134EA_000537 [Puccinia striiformis f. sp. tritici]